MALPHGAFASAPPDWYSGSCGNPCGVPAIAGAGGTGRHSTSIVSDAAGSRGRYGSIGMSGPCGSWGRPAGVGSAGVGSAGVGPGAAAFAP